MTSVHQCREDKLMRILTKEVITLVLLFIVLLGVGAAPLLAQTIDIADPGSSEPYHPALVQYRVGNYFQLQGDHERAIEEFTAVIAAFPNWDGGYSARGDSYAALGQYELAIADYDEALDLTPGFVSVLYMRGRAFAAIGEIELADADYANAIQQVPDYALPYWGMGDLAYERGDLTAALSCYQEYMAITLTTPDAEVIARVGILEANASAGGA